MCKYHAKITVQIYYKVLSLKKHNFFSLVVKNDNVHHHKKCSPKESPQAFN